MNDLARLGLDIDSSDVVKANRDIDHFSKSAKTASGSADKFGKAGNALAGGMVRAATAIGAVVASMAGIAGGIRTIAEFERQMSTVGAVSRATAEELQAMRDIAAELGRTTEFTAKQAGEGLEFLARAGFSASDSIAAIPAVLDLATASAMGLGAAADISSNIMSAFGIAATDAASVADILAAASSRANTDVAQLGAAMSFVGPIAASLDISMSDAAAAVGVLSDAGIQGSTAGTGLRRVLSSLANPTTEATARLNALGLTMQELNPQTNSITEIVGRLADAGLGAADALTVFGDRGGPAILALTSQVGSLRELTSALTDVDGEANRMANTMRDNLGGDIDGLMSSLEGLVLALGDAGLTAVLRALVKLLTETARAMTAVVNAVREFFSAMSDLFATQSNQEVINATLEASFDNVTISVGDQLVALRQLQQAQKDGMPVSAAQLEAQLAELKARQENFLALEKERKALALQSPEFQKIAAQIRVAQDAMRSTPRTFAFREQFEQAEQAVVDALNAQREFLATLDATTGLTQQEIAARQEIEAAIAEAKGRLDEMNSAASEGVTLTKRITIVSGQITFADATESARLLAAQLGVALDEAVGINNALNAAAGIQTPGPTTLGFSVGMPSGAIPGGFVDAGGQLSFGDLNGPKVTDFRSKNHGVTASVGGGGGGVSEAERQAAAIDKVVKSLRDEIEVIGLSDQARRTHQALQRAGVDITSEEGQKIADLVEEYSALAREQEANAEISKTLKDAIIDFADGGADAIDGLAKSIKRMAIEALLFGEGPLGGLFGGAEGGGLLKSLFAGFLDGGGRIGAGQFGVVGERRPEIVTGPANVIGGAETARMMSGGDMRVDFRVINNRPGNEISQRRERGPDGRQVLIAEINEAATAGQLDRGFGGRFGAQPQKARR